MSEKVQTRSFVHGEKFWEISWTGPIVEVASGTRGKAGRTRERVFESAGERDAFIAAQVASAVKKGFVEVDPSRIETPDVVDPAVARFDALAKKLRRTAFVPVLVAGEPADPAASKLGGDSWLAATDDDPTCGICGEAMHFLLQLRRDDVPATWRHVFTKDMIQLFLCDRVCQAEGGSRPFAKTTLARHVDLGLAAAAPRARDVAAFPAKAVTGWTEHDDYPRYEDGIDEAGDVDPLELIDALRARGCATLPGEKLGGWPDWVQSPKRPRCPCGGTMEPFFQVDTNCALPIQFGDLGVGWMIGCGRCRTLSFAWQCH